MISGLSSAAGRPATRDQAAASNLNEIEPMEATPSAPDATSASPFRAFAILNARSGSCDVAVVKAELARCFGAVTVDYHELNEGEDLAKVVADALASGVHQVVAGGGDGTILAVASLLVGADVHFACLPLGTANVLARELGIPTDLPGAARLAASQLVEHDQQVKTSRVATIDAMKLAGRHYLTQVGVGIDALMIQNTSTDAKRRLGRLAYLITAAKHILAFQSHRFEVTVDGQKRKLRASQIVVANTGMMGQPPFRWGPDIHADDGRLNICFIKSAGLRDYARLFWVVFRGHREKTPNMRHQSFERELEIRSRHPLPVQADGEIVGETPIRIELIHQALRIIVPLDDPRVP